MYAMWLTSNNAVRGLIQDSNMKGWLKVLTN